ncbi:MAG: MBOAT family protein [Bacteroidales bacterium]|jgi:alginate O-acetyltransferase complex protein AlgI|nr:MBOAT family protein [Bacteroidales bacterium]MDI9592970.1 MBOAT family protein [Bacteroidota bacterium]OQC38148.1 MAG: Peptidoglycan O-acetyltransferase [Bacteroidetes bacterium ADurb.Bin041]HNV50603.1 MBOAT family protein [Bacteroidales bacterium]HOF81414.1 MBOAT family protein [Bacteroidales bacterium]
MVFSSNLFLLYFLPSFLIVYYIIPRKLKNLFTLLASIFFYAWGAPDFIFIVLAAIIIDFYIVDIMHKSTLLKAKRILLGISVLINIGLLAYFKYANFLVENFNEILSLLGYEPINWASVALPIGISFFTFQKLTYSVDVYRKVHTPLKRVTDYAMYILMFPQLIAGPIIRFNEIADQIENRRAFETIDAKLLGFFRFVVGLSKKVLIANVLGEQVDKIFSMTPIDISTPLAWIGVVAYSFQIYYDFSGYSDMAIGIGKMIGFKFPENFNNPYISLNITEFWRRWHMTLGRWMRDYLYIPLGGNKVSKSRLYFNLWVVFLISGLWHGAAWNFVVWGAFHGFFLIADRMFLIKLTKPLGKFTNIILTYFITLIGWVLFRADTLGYAFQYIKRMFAFDGVKTSLWLDAKFNTILVIGAIFAFIAAFGKIESWWMNVLNKPKSNTVTILLIFVSVIFTMICIGAITSSSFNPFIYFRF